jgi:hypothetical protein
MFSSFEEKKRPLALEVALGQPMAKTGYGVFQPSTAVLYSTL